MRTVSTVAELRAAVATARADGRRIGLVPTMGALHEGHLSLVRDARGRADVVVTTIFVNPLQFGAGEDLDAYPRDLAADEALLSGLGDLAPDLVFAPSVTEVYPRPVRTTVTVAGLTDVMCGASRPGHFDGVTTVVSKLFNLVLPDVAVFGRKDYQQLQVIRRMVADLDVPVEVVGAPIVREADGLALSSRNRYLDPEQRRVATVLSRSLRAAIEAARAAGVSGQADLTAVLAEAVTGTLRSEPQARTDYVAIVDPDDLTPTDRDRQPDASDRTPGTDGGEGPHGRSAPEAPRTLVAIAAYVGPARLIDNVVIGDPADEERVLAATGGTA